MTDNVLFCAAVEKATRADILSPRLFALCFDTDDRGERTVRLRYLRDRACGDYAPADNSMPGFGLAVERFEEARRRCYDAFQADPQGFIEGAVSDGLWQSAALLRAKKLEPVRYLVEGFLPQGLVLLASPPKYGKSWLALDLCCAVAGGTPFLGMPTRQAACLYMALEDGEQRLQRRLDTLLGPAQTPQGLYYRTSASTLADGLLLELETFLQRHPDCGLVVVDTLQKVRGADTGQSGTLYAADYAVMGQLKEFADQHKLCLLLVHHLRKMSDDADPFNRIAGSNGIFGAADAAIVLTRDKREDARTVLDLTGRDVEDRRLVLRFDKTSCRWQSLGTPAEVERAELAGRYDDDPLAGTVRSQVEASGRWQTNAKGFIAACEAQYGACPVDTGRALAKELDRLAPLLQERDGIACKTLPNGSGGRVYAFTRPAKAPAARPAG